MGLWQYNAPAAISSCCHLLPPDREESHSPVKKKGQSGQSRLPVPLREQSLWLCFQRHGRNLHCFAFLNFRERGSPFPQKTQRGETCTQAHDVLEVVLPWHSGKAGCKPKFHRDRGPSSQRGLSHGLQNTGPQGKI